jgi:hypothetical protein
VTTDEHRREEEPQEVRRACTGGLLYAAQPPVGRLYAAQSPIGLLPLRRAAAGQPPGSTSAAVGLSHPAPSTPSICISPALPPPLPLPAMHAACFLSPAGRPRAPEGRGWKVGGGAGGGYDFRLSPGRTAPVSRISGSFFVESVLGDRLVQIRLPPATELELKPCQRHPQLLCIRLRRLHSYT